MDATMGFDLSEDLGPSHLAIIWFLTGISGTALALRVYCKQARHRGLWWDDHTLILAWVCSVVAISLNTRQVQLGFGRHFPTVPLQNLEEMGFLGAILGFFAINAILLSKASFAFTMLRITKGWARYSVITLMITATFLMEISAVLNAIQCSPVEKLWKPYLPGTCISTQAIAAFGVTSGAYSGAMDIFLALLPWTIIPQLQMRTKEKIGIAIAMSMGLFAGATAFIKCVKLNELNSNDFTFDGVSLVQWGEAETAVTVIATSIPVFRVLISEFRSKARSYFRSRSDQDGKSTFGTYATSTRNNTVVTGTRSSQWEDHDGNAGDRVLSGTIATYDAEGQRHGHGQRSGSMEPDIELETMPTLPNSYLHDPLRHHPMDGTHI